MSEPNNPSYPVSVMDHRVMNRVLRHRLRNLCAGVKMTMERIAAATAVSNPQIGPRCDIVVAEIDNLRDMTSRMDLLFDQLPTSHAKSLFEIVTAIRTAFVPKFPFCKLAFDGPEAMVSFVHGDWLIFALSELIFNAGEGSGDTAEVSFSWKNDSNGFTFSIDNGSAIPPEIPTTPPVPFMTSKSRHDGLGLAIAWRICEAIGASLQIETMPGEEDAHTRITINLPAAEINHA